MASATKPTQPSLYDELKGQLRGELIQQGDAGYDAARKVNNGMIDRRPAAIAYCADVADVMSTVNFARDRKLLLAVRGGGHNAAGLGVCDDGLVLDLGRGCAASASTRRRARCAPRAAACSATSTTRRTPSARRCRPASCRPPGWPG